MNNPNSESEWEVMAKEWVSTLPEGKIISPDEIEAWQAHLPDNIKSMPTPQLHQRLASIHSTITQPTQENDVNYDHRFQRTGQWLPVYTWLESIKDTKEGVNTKDILDWLSANPNVRDDLQSRHSRGHLMHYIKQCHLKILKRKEKKKGLPLTDKANTDIVSKGEEGKLAVPLPCSTMNNLPTDSDLYVAKRSEALHKYEILVDLEKQLSTIFPKPQLLNK
ncbi:Serine/threonine-protein kinase RIO1-like [Heracleum sosnowskyi]|uniref:Serine/threonine-protein kinase RIO1-like n=1 Tax=Heracleum sosnowskyi TaxID=360622 RepID=A0AAD8H4R3_9APIA|nr:Serine/threonine-protein kinase RIO1-like [Heracleum sosnowskyi]